MDTIDALSRSRCRERRLNNVKTGPSVYISKLVKHFYRFMLLLTCIY